MFTLVDRSSNDRYVLPAKSAEESTVRLLLADPEQKHHDYRAGIESAREAFEYLLEQYEEAGNLDSTLVVYTSDHSEMLGEYGVFGHTHLAVPEVVYTPTVFVHPEIEPGERDDLLHHVDILPTVAEVLSADVDVGRTHGIPFGTGRSRRCNYFQHHNYASLSLFDPLIERTKNRTVRSIWDANGGHTYTTCSWTQLLLLGVGLATIATASDQLRASRKYRAFYDQFRPGHRVHGSPSFDEAEAGRLVDERLGEDAEVFERELSTDTEQQLEDMGYL